MDTTQSRLKEVWFGQPPGRGKRPKKENTCQSKMNELKKIEQKPGKVQSKTQPTTKTWVWATVLWGIFLFKHLVFVSSFSLNFRAEMSGKLKEVPETFCGSIAFFEGFLLVLSCWLWNATFVG